MVEGVAIVVCASFDGLEPAALIETVERYFARQATDRIDLTSTSPIIAEEIKTSPFSPILDSTRLHYTLWGTRGSTPTPGGRFLRHGAEARESTP